MAKELSEEQRRKKRERHREYYQETAFKYPMRRWTKAECEEILLHEKTDRQLSYELERSMKSISNKRSRLLNEAKTGGVRW